MSYKVLLIDDQYESAPLQDFVLNASYEGIEIDCVGFHKEGIEILKNDKQGVYRAVILDATGYLSERDFEAGKDLNNVGLTHSLKYLDGKESDDIIPWFIYSGAPRNIGSEEFEENVKAYQSDYKFGRPEICYYIKSQDEDALFEDIKVEVDKLSSTRTVFKYTDFFTVIQEIPNLVKHRKALIEILEEKESTQDYTIVRKILESLFKALSELNIIPEGFTEEKSWINGTSRFLSGIHEAYTFHDSNFIHPTICETLHRVLNIVQDGSHNEGKLKYKVDEYSKLHSSGYLYRSMVYALLEIICYFGDLIKNNPDVKINSSRWSKNLIREELAKDTELIRGKVINLNVEKGFAFFKPDVNGSNIYIPAHLVTEHRLNDGAAILVEIEQYSSNSSQEIKSRVKVVKII